MKKAKKAKAKKPAKKTAKKAAKKISSAGTRKPSKKAGKKKSAKKAAPKKARVGMTAVLAGGEPDHRCKRTLEPGVCLKFFRNANGDFDQPLGGVIVPCSECRHFF